jgi:hypothetical protein
VRIEVEASVRLPEGWQEGASISVGAVRDAADPHPLHLGHPLVRAAVEEARAAKQRHFTVSWKLDASAPAQLRRAKGKRGRLALTSVRYEGFERVERLLPAAVMEGNPAPLDAESAAWLLDHRPADRRAFQPPLALEDEIHDAVEELLFADQADVAGHEQQHFERSLEQIERYVEDRMLVLRRGLAEAGEALRAAEDRRDAALGSDARGQAEERIRKLQSEIDSLEAQVEFRSRFDAGVRPGAGGAGNRAPAGGVEVVPPP